MNDAAIRCRGVKKSFREGDNVLPVLKGDAPSQRETMFWQRRSDKAARVGRYKWVESSKGGGLFDLESDLGEKRDQMLRFASRVAEGQAMLGVRHDPQPRIRHERPHLRAV